ncbi:MAG: dynamin family protein [Cyanobacteria bacterium P01_A01_bin.84]
MFDVLAPIVFERVVTPLVDELVSIFGEKLRQKWLGTTPEDTTTKVEIEDAVIKEKIEELVEQNERIQDYIQINNETTEQLIKQVLSEIKRVSANTPDLKVGDDQIGLLEPMQEENKEFNPQDLTAWLEKIHRSLEGNINRRLAEIQEKPSPQVDNKQDLALATNDDNGQVLPSDENEEPSVKEDSESEEMLKKLDEYKEYGESVLRGIKSLEEHNQWEQDKNFNNSQLQECLTKLKTAASKIVERASSPVNIAIMGQFSSGKTQLIESLIGYGGILPVEDIPTTGNITAIHLIEQDGFKATEFGQFRVKYFSESEVQECLKFMLEEAKKRAKQLNLELRTLPQVNSETFNEKTLNDYESWCEQVWDNHQDSELRNLLLELVIFIRTCISYGTHLYNQSLEIGSKSADRVLGLSKGSISPTPTSELKFEDIPKVKKISVDTNEPSQELLQNSFSLIRRVNIDVKISKDIWELGTTQETSKFILLDFPGLGASNSKVRDEFVSQQELKSVQTVLILLNGDASPGGDGANQTLRMTKRIFGNNPNDDRILVGVSRFNQLPLDEQKLDELIRDDSLSSSLTQEDALNELITLRTIIKDAKALGSKQEIVLLDQRMGLKKLAERRSGVQVGSPGFLAKLKDPSFLKDSKSINEKWGLLSKRLLKTDQHSVVGQMLRDFADDGGIIKLRELLLEHVAAHGLKQLYEDTTKAENTLSTEQEQLYQILSELNILNEESKALKDLRFYLENIYSTYKDFQDNLGQEPLKDWQGKTVSDVVKDEVTYRILNWKQWTLLFTTAQNGIIELSSLQENEEDPFNLEDNKDDNIPTKSDDFYEVFDNTVKELQDFADERIKEGVDNLLNKSSDKLKKEINYLKPILHEEMKTYIKEEFGTEASNIFSVLYQGYDLKQKRDYITKLAFKEKKPIDSASAFPLARKDEKHNHGQIFDWAPEYRKAGSERLSQLLLVERLRDEITASISLQLIEYVSQTNKKVDRAILNILKVLVPRLSALLQNKELLRYIAGDEHEANEDNSISLILSEIASTHTP